MSKCHSTKTISTRGQAIQGKYQAARVIKLDVPGVNEFLVKYKT